VVAALALVGYRKYIHNAQVSEAKVVMGMIRSGEESYRQDTNTYLACSANLSTYYPNATPNDTKWVWERSNDTRYNSPVNGWAQLGVHPDAPVRFGYAVTTGVGPTLPGPPDSAFTTPPPWAALPTGTPWYVVAAKNTRIANGLPSLAITASWDGSIYTEGEDR
jgi:hypothetical protein